MAYTLIETVTVGSGGASSIEFAGIPQETGADLVIRLSARGGNELTDLSFNSDTGTNYTYRFLKGTGSTASSQDSSSEAIRFYGITEDSRTANTFSNAEIRISNYTSTTAKSVSIDGVTENNATYAIMAISAGSYSGTSAITSVKLASNGDVLDEHTTASLYLVTTADASGATVPVPKATGGSISLAGGYWIHSFTSSGTFTPTENLTGVEYVVLAGGAAGGGNYQGNAAAGGGAAGGYRSSVISESSGGGGSAESTVSVTASTGYAVTVGAGGSGNDGNYSGNNGSDSSAFSVTSTGGGGGARSGQSTAGKSGGSGGGGGSKTPTGSSGTGGGGGSGTTNQGFGGGEGGNSGTNASSLRGGGGGGAGGAGVTGFGNSDGGVGLTTSISGSAVKLAGGGQGGYFMQANPTQHDTSWGGGKFSNGFPGFQASPGGGDANKGAGGGGGCDPYNGGSGGSGIVIVRYAA